jgi:hypothetical protein
VNQRDRGDLVRQPGRLVASSVHSMESGSAGQSFQLMPSAAAALASPLNSRWRPRPPRPNSPPISTPPSPSPSPRVRIGESPLTVTRYNEDLTRQLRKLRGYLKNVQHHLASDVAGPDRLWTKPFRHDKFWDRGFPFY